MGTRALAGVSGYPYPGTRVHVPWSVFQGWNSYASGTLGYAYPGTRVPGYPVPWPCRARLSGTLVQIFKLSLKRGSSREQSKWQTLA
eukprot:3364081-Rhodomonas_salina.1